MKSKVFISLFALMLGGLLSSGFANNTSKKIKVKGACDMCETRIEKASKSVNGVSSSDWDKQSNTLTVTFDETATSTLEIEKAIAKVGHDTENVKADDAVYNNLPDCCKYERMEKKAYCKTSQEACETKCKEDTKCKEECNTACKEKEKKSSEECNESK